MKKNLFLASALIMGMMSSCSSEIENVTVPGADQNLQPVELSIASPSVIVSARGIGTVGSIAGSDENKWNGEDLYVNMMCYYKDGKDAWEVSAWNKIDANGTETSIANFNNVKVQAPTGYGNNTTLTIPKSDEGRYYPPTSSKHHFFAYHIDDAMIGSNYTENVTTPVIVDDVDNKVRKVYFKIDGSQDLMMGKAVASAATAKPELNDFLFSAKSARGGVIPSLVMNHLLTRFTFNVQTDVEGNNLQIEKIIVKSKDRGTMCVAYAEDQENLLDFTDNVASLELKDATKGNDGKLKALEPVELTKDFQSIGSALMVAPGENSYDITIVASQTVGLGQTHKFSYNSQIKVAGGALAGSSYKVNITLYGLQEIKIEAVLTGWNEAGEDINLTPGEDF